MSFSPIIEWEYLEQSLQSDWSAGYTSGSILHAAVVRQDSWSLFESLVSASQPGGCDFSTICHSTCSFLLELADAAARLMPRDIAQLCAAMSHDDNGHADGGPVGHCDYTSRHVPIWHSQQKKKTKNTYPLQYPTLWYTAWWEGRTWQRQKCLFFSSMITALNPI